MQILTTVYEMKEAPLFACSSLVIVPSVMLLKLEWLNAFSSKIVKF